MTFTNFNTMLRNTIVSLAAVLLLGASAFAATITGTVTDKTTGKPSAGDNVDLLALQQGMSVLASTKTDSRGAFKFNVDDTGSPHLVRVTHDGVSYFPAGGPMQPGATSASLEVYDAAGRVDGISTNVDVVRYQSDGTNLQVMELFAVKNASNPPRAMNGDKTYDFYLPEGAQIDQVLVQGPGGMPITASAAPEGNSGKYAFNYAIKPGETRFEVAYHLPYSGQASFAPKVTSDIQHFVVMTPKSMTFTPKGSAKFSPMDDQNSNVLVATNVTPATNLAFQISGTGTLPDDNAQPGDQSQGSPSQGSSAMAADSRPGGGLGPPIDAPDPLHSYRWVILGGLGIVLVCGAVFVVNRSGQAVTPVPVATTTLPPAITAKAAAVSAPAPPTDRAAMLLEGLKEELFQLEVEKQQGRISAAEYESAKAALDQTLRRALARKSS